MWIFTRVGLFSIVQKPNQDFLTIRARVASDLDGLRNKYLPSLSPTLEAKTFDYRYFATIRHEDFAQGLAQIARDIRYDNFKEEVKRVMGERRAEVYGRVWSLLLELQNGNCKAAETPTELR